MLVPKSSATSGLILALLCLSTASCATRLDYQSPPTVDLSGTWVLNPEESEEIILTALKRNDRSSNNSLKRNNSDRSGQRQGGKPPGGKKLADLHLGGRAKLTKPDAMISKEMTIDQGPYSMGVRYENENYRDVDWGKKEYRGVTTKAGWEGDVLKVITDGKRREYSESYQLDENGKTLIVVIAVGDKKYLRTFSSKNVVKVKSSISQ